MTVDWPFPFQCPCMSGPCPIVVSVFFLMSVAVSISVRARTWLCQWLDGAEVSASGWGSRGPWFQSHPRLTFQPCSRYQLNQLGSKAASESTFKRSNTCGVSNTRLWLLIFLSVTVSESMSLAEIVFDRDRIRYLVCYLVRGAATYIWTCHSPRGHINVLRGYVNACPCQCQWAFPCSWPCQFRDRCRACIHGHVRVHCRFWNRACSHGSLCDCARVHVRAHVHVRDRFCTGI